jgi:CubicO group peptidase (beta-lactamase class C family)
LQPACIFGFRVTGSDNGGYGYQWWVTSEHGHPSFVAVGFGGQFIQVIPDLDLVVVITSDAANHRGDAQNLVGEAIIPAITDRPEHRHGVGTSLPQPPAGGGR